MPPIKRTHVERIDGMGRISVHEVTSVPGETFEAFRARVKDLIGHSLPIPSDEESGHQNYPRAQEAIASWFNPQEGMGDFFVFGTDAPDSTKADPTGLLTGYERFEEHGYSAYRLVRMRADDWKVVNERGPDWESWEKRSRTAKEIERKIREKRMKDDRGKIQESLA